MTISKRKTTVNRVLMFLLAIIVAFGYIISSTSVNALGDATADYGQGESAFDIDTPVVSQPDSTYGMDNVESNNEALDDYYNDEDNFYENNVSEERKEESASNVEAAKEREEAEKLRPTDPVDYNGTDCIISGENGTLVIHMSPSSTYEYESPSFLDLLFGNNPRFWGELLAPAVAENYAGLIDEIDDKLDKNEELLTQSLTGEDNNAWAKIYNLSKSICQNVILPIAGAVLAFILVYEIYEIVCTRNNMSDIGAGTFIQLIIKMLIAVLVVANAWTLTQWVFEIGQWTVTQAGALDTDFGMLAEYNFEDKKWIFYNILLMDPNGDLNMGTMLGLIMQSWLLDIVMRVMMLIINVIIYVRLIEIYLISAVAPIPLATMSNRQWGMTGFNYIRNVVALAFQALLLFMCLAMYAELVSLTFEATTISSLTSTIWAILGYSIILIFCCFKTSGLSKSIFGAH